jgi:hypothetical protein
MLPLQTRLTSVTFCQVYLSLRGRDELAVARPDTIISRSIQWKTREQGVRLAPSTTGTDKYVHDVEIFHPGARFPVTRSKREDPLFLRLELNILLDLIVLRDIARDKEVVGSDVSRRLLVYNQTGLYAKEGNEG